MWKPHHNSDLASRLTVLEHRQRALLLIGGLSVLLVLSAFGFRDQEVVRARRVELLDAGGRTRAALATDSAWVNLTLYDTRGRITASMRLNGDPRLLVLDESSHEVAALGAPRVQHLKE